MADMDLESLKTLFENLADRLDKTSTGEESVDGLSKIRDTLRDMIKQINTQGSDTQVKKNAQAFVKEFFDEWNRINPMKDVEDAIAAAADKDGGGGSTILDELTGSGGNAAKAQSDLAKQTGLLGKVTKGSAADLQKSLGTTSGRMKVLGATITGTIGAGKAALAWMGSQADAYRELLGSAEGTISSYQQFSRTALDAGMTVKDLADAMKDGTQGARLLGAEGFAKLTKSVRNATISTGLMGYSLQDLIKRQGDYADFLASQGQLNANNPDVGTMTQGIVRMVKLNDTIATILGQTRQEALDAAKQAAQDANYMSAALSKGISSQNAGNLENFATQLFGSAGANYVKNIVNSPTGQPTEADAAVFQQVNGQAAAILRNLVDQTKNNQDATQAFKNASVQLRNVGIQQRNSPELGLRAFLGSIGVANGAFGASNIFAMRAPGLKTNGIPPSEQNNAGTVGLLNMQLIQKDIETTAEKLRTFPFDAGLDEWGKEFKDATLKLHDFNNVLGQILDGMNKNTKATAYAGVAILGVVGALTVFGTALGAITGAKGVTGLLGNFAKLFTKVPAGAAAAGEGAAAEGTMLASGELAAGGAAGGGLAAALLPVAAVGGGVAGTLLSVNSISKKNGQSLLGNRANEGGLLHSRAANYAEATAGGALAGAGIGALFGGIGAVPGAAIGAGIGAGGAFIGDHWANVQNWWNHSKPGAPAGGVAPGQPNQPAQPGQTQPNQQVSSQSIEQILNKMVNETERANAHLKSLVERADTEILMLKHELDQAKTFNERLLQAHDETRKQLKLSIGW